jgi:hypothetical protein
LIGPLVLRALLSLVLRALLPILLRALVTFLPGLVRRAFPAGAIGGTLGIGLRRRGRWRDHALDGRGETIRQAAEIVVFAILIGFGLFAGRALIAISRLLLGLLGRGDQPEIMLRMLEIALRHDGIAGGLRIPCELEVLFADVMSGASNLNIRPIGFIRPGKRIGALTIAPTTTAAAATHTFVLTRSHR